MSDSEEEKFPPTKARKFENASELLPLKIDGKLVRRFKADDNLEDDIKQEIESVTSEAPVIKKSEPQKELTVHELLCKQKRLLDEAKLDISTSAHALVYDPQEHYGKLRQLYKYCIGEDIDYLIRESIQKVAIASLTEVFVSIVPGYQIRTLTEEEQKQKMKAETRKILQFEQNLLNNYQKFLSMLENNAMKLIKTEVGKEASFTAKLGVLSTKCLRQLLAKLPHFNGASDIISCLVHLAASPNETVVEEACAAISDAFKDDNLLIISTHGAKAIADCVNKKKGHVAPHLVFTLLSLNLKLINRSALDSKQEESSKSKPNQHISKQTRKRNKRKKKIEDPLREAEAAERLSVLSQRATETMKYVFMTYFRILKRMTTTALLAPVLQGLTKFGHLINVEFFEDLVHSLSNIVDQKHLKLIDSLGCIKTVCIILSGEGQALNIDPLKFYNTFYSIMPNLVFQDEEALIGQIRFLTDCLNMLLIKRRRLVSIKRVASFVKRLLLISILLPTRCVISILSILRFIFVAHPGLLSLLDGNDEENIANGIFQPDSSDPDCSNGMSTDFIKELTLLSKHPDKTVNVFAKNLLHQLPSNGLHRLNAQIANAAPNDWLDAEVNVVESPFKNVVKKFCQKNKIAFTSNNVCSTMLRFLEESNSR
ncbi:nucleolar complex-associated protein domain-containing protein [Ditylenchus destructor]|uniref:NOC3-like protein n=1 Tax=Ditylenchus destructor TaxID=166010 RepID=A0AAD4N853_9BILA|nr:nucleolar complex-associated protein domain-containing protein [Ditylenchus destructor]